MAASARLMTDLSFELFSNLKLGVYYSSSIDFHQINTMTGVSLAHWHHLCLTTAITCELSSSSSPTDLRVSVKVLSPLSVFLPH